jgi:hypothetical protein
VQVHCAKPNIHVNRGIHPRQQWVSSLTIDINMQPTSNDRINVCQVGFWHEHDIHKWTSCPLDDTQDAAPGTMPCWAQQPQQAMKDGQHGMT